MDVAILGSTGSIGTNAIEVCLNQHYNVVALTCNSRADLLIEQYYQLRPKFLAVENELAYKKIKDELKFEDVVVLGKGGTIEIAKNYNYDVILNAIVGYAGLLPTYQAVKSSKRLAIANKESLVVYGEELMKIAKEYDTELIPVDSEHSAIFQCLQGNYHNEIEKILLTASGGAFRNLSMAEIAKKPAKDALKHPNWDMGNKITIDSATMMNKGLELIEAMRLFNVKADDIDIVIHPQSIVHSGIKFRDKSLICQLGTPDMKLPIQYALNFPNRYQNNCQDLDLCDIVNLEFFKPDFEKFPCLKIAKEVAKKGGFYPCIMNSANEYAVDLYLKGKIGFYDINKIIDKALDKGFNGDSSNIEDIINCSKEFSLKSVYEEDF